MPGVFHDSLPGYEGWLIKLSNVPSGHKDSKQEGRVEYACSAMARAAGISMPPTRLFEIPSAKGPRGLFGVQRFDRSGSKKIHAHSLAGLLQIDFRAITCTYEDWAKAALELSGELKTARTSGLENWPREAIYGD